MLDKTELPYEVHLVDFGENDQLTPEIHSLSPNNIIPAILDPHGPDGKTAGALRVGRDFDLARGPSLWDGCDDAQMGDGVDVEPDWDEVAQPAPDEEADQRVSG